MDDASTSVHASQGVQVGNYNTQTNLNLDPAAVLPSADSVPVPAGMHNLPLASAVFVGRDLDQLTGLLAGGRGVIGQAIHGLGGIGKTELAVHYARHNAHRYPLIWWITADTPERITLGLAELTGWLHPVPSLTAGRSWAIRWLQAHPGWLLALDNVEEPRDITDLLGALHGRGTILVTTRRDIGDARWKRLGLAPLQLPRLPRAASVDLLITLTDQNDPAGAVRLAEDLGDLPLALEQAAAYLTQHGQLTFDGYRELLATRFSRVAAQPGEGGDAMRTIHQVWSVTIAAVTHRSILAARILAVLAYLTPDNIPEDILSPLADDVLDVAEALQLLASYNMIARDGKTISIHRLVQAVSRVADHSHIYPATASTPLNEAIKLLWQAAPDDPMINIEGWSRWNELLPHIDAVNGHSSDEHQNEDLSILTSMAGAYLLGQGQQDRAIRLSEKAFADCQRILGDDNHLTLSACNNLARCYDAIGRSAEAVSLLEQALVKAQQLPDVDHPNTLAILNNLARSYQSTKRLAEAIALFEQTLTDRMRVFGDDDPRVFTTRNNLAYAYHEAGRLGESIELHTKNLADRVRVLGSNHPMTLNTLHALALAHKKIGQTAEAIAFHEKALAGRIDVLGNGHPDTLESQSGLADAYHAAGRLDEAVRLHELALAGRRRTLGDSHRDTLGGLADLVYIYQITGRAVEAIPLCEQAALVHQHIFGRNHPSALASRNNLAVAHLLAGSHAEAVSILKQVVTESQRSLRYNHPDTLKFRRNLALAYASCGRATDAIKLLRQLLSASERVLGSYHSLTREVARNLAKIQASRDGTIGSSVELNLTVLPP